MWYINLLVSDFSKYGLGFSWDQWFRIHYIGTVILFIAGVLFGFWQGKFWWRRIYEKKRIKKKNKKYFLFFLGFAVIVAVIIIDINKPSQVNQPGKEEQEQEYQASEDVKSLNIPLRQAEKRITKKPFGIKISPENSPISPERFSGYHTGIDYEIFENEQNIDVEVFAICSGKLLKKERVSGYGGALIQECELEGQPAIVLYGHIELNSVEQNPGDYVLLGDPLALLGEAFSRDTDGERKHLHIGIHKGTAMNVRGYVQNELELKNWIDFETYRKN
jgi:hypothetical protein